MKVAAKILSTVNGQLSTALILLSLFALFTLTLTFAPAAQAQSPQNRDTIVKNDLNSIADGLNEMLWGKPNGEKGALGGVASLIASLYSVPPASGVNYLAQKFHQLNPIQPAYAQPVGTQVLDPTLKLWRVFRDTTYIGFVLVFVVIGFMVMFRAHISPQAVATIQDSLPRVVIALILVTFSFAIAGLLIDLMFLFLNVAINLLTQAGLQPAGQRVAFEKNVFTVYRDNWDDVFGAVSDVVESTLNQILDLDDNPLMKIVGFLSGKALGIVGGIALLFVMFKVFLMLLTSYAMILLLTIFSPFFFLMQALPGQNGAKNWLKQYVANLSVFPTVVIMLLIGGLLGELGGLGGEAGSSGFSEATVGFFPLLSGIINTGSVAKLIGLGFLFMTPEAANLIKKFIGAQGGPGFGGAGAAALGAGLGVAGAGAKFAGREAMRNSGFPYVGGAWRRGREAEAQEKAQTRAGLATFSSNQPGAAGEAYKKKYKTPNR